MSCAPSSRPAALWGSTRSRSGTSTCDSSQSIERDRIRGHADVARVVGVAVDDACLTSDEPRPRCSASSNALRRHRAEVDLRPGLGVQEVGRRSPAWALRPALRQPMQPAERVGHATPVGLRLGRSALHVCHHHQTVREQPAVRRRDRHRHGQTFTVEVLEELGLPRGSASLLAPRRPTARCPLTRTLHTSLATRQRAVRCERRLHPTARVPPIPPVTFSRSSGHRSCKSQLRK